MAVNQIPGPMGWGVQNETKDQWIAKESRTRDEIADVAPELMSRNSAKATKNVELEAEVDQAIKNAGWDEGFMFPFLFAIATGIIPEWLAQLIGSCVQSGSIRTGAYRCVTETHVLNDPEELPGNKLAGVDSIGFFGPFGYRGGRREAGIDGFSDGSLCLPQIRSDMKYGKLPCSTPGLQSDAFPEPQSERLYRQWGANNQLMDQFIDMPTVKLLESEKVTDADDAVELIRVHKKPLNFCSMMAFKSTGRRLGNGPDGKPIFEWVPDPRNEWAHNLSVVGVVKRNGKTYLIIENSWFRFHDGTFYFALEINYFAQWLRSRYAECQSVGEHDLFDNGPAVVWS